MNKRTLIGVLIDFSSSMRWSWNNTNGEELPRVQAIHDAILGHLRSINLKTVRNDIDYSKIELFCLGSGFVRNVFINNVQFSFREEKVNDDTMMKTRQADVVCDLLALSEIIPDANEIRQIKAELNKRWNKYSAEIIDSIETNKDSYNELALFIESSLRESALLKLQRSSKYRALRFLRNISKGNSFSKWQERLNSYILLRTELIKKVATDDSAEQVENVTRKSREIVDLRKDDFSSYIAHKLNDFLSDQSIVLLDLLVVSRNHSFVLNHFNQKLLNDLTNEIYQHLKTEVDNEIGNFWKISFSIPRIQQLKIGAKIDAAELQKLVEDCMRRDIWYELRPFIEEIIQNLFESIFVAQFRERIPYWIGLASSREVIKPLSKISLLIPETTDINLYSDEYMYGIAPIKESLDRCAIRFTNKDHNRKNKILVLFSDGEFENANRLFDPLRVADVIKQSGVRIVCFYVGDKDVTQKGSTALKKSAPQGAITMHNMASKFDCEEPIEQEMIKRGFAIPQSEKLFFQINKADILNEVLQVILVNGYAVTHTA